MDSFVLRACATNLYSGEWKIFSSKPADFADLTACRPQVFQIKVEKGHLMIWKSDAAAPPYAYEHWVTTHGKPSNVLGVFDPDGELPDAVFDQPPSRTVEELLARAVGMLAREVRALEQYRLADQRQIIELRQLVEEKADVEEFTHPTSTVPSLSAETFGPPRDTWTGTMLRQVLPMWHLGFAGVAIWVNEPTSKLDVAVVIASDGRELARWKADGSIAIGWCHLMLATPIAGQGFGLELQIGGGPIGLAQTQSVDYAAEGMKGQMVAMQVWRAKPGYAWVPLTKAATVRQVATRSMLTGTKLLTPGDEAYETLSIRKDGIQLHALRRGDMVVIMPVDSTLRISAAFAAASLSNKNPGPLRARLQIVAGHIETLQDAQSADVLGDSGWLDMTQDGPFELKVHLLSVAKTGSPMWLAFSVQLSDNASQNSAWVQFSDIGIEGRLPEMLLLQL